MRKMYQTTDKKKRAEQYRKDAEACEKARVFGLAEVNWQMAALLDPYIEPEY